MMETAPKRAPSGLGLIYGKVGTTSFTMAVHADVDLRRNDYVEAPHEQCGIVLGQVEDIERVTDLSFDRAQLLSHGEQIEVGEQVTAHISVIGYRDERGVLLAPRTPFSGGTIVHNASEKLIKEVLGLKQNKATGALLGNLKGFELPVYLDINDLVQRHIAILARTGAGKSYVVGVFIEELIKHGVAVVVLDPHGEYGSLMHPNDNARDVDNMARYGVKPMRYTDRVVQFTPDPQHQPQALPLVFDEVNLGLEDLMELCDIKNNGPHRGILNRALKQLAKERQYYNLADVIKTVKADKHPARHGLVNQLDYLRALRIFGEPPTRISSLIAEGQCTIITLKGVAPDLQDLVTSRLVQKIFIGRKLGRIPPLVLVVEEAHTFCPQVGQTRCGPVLKTIAGEGRKFGMGMCVVSQRPAKIDKNVLSQCGTQVILKVTNPNDLKAISSSIEGLTAGMEENIQRLPTGSALISGGGAATPIIIDVRPRETRHGGQSVSVVSPSAYRRTMRQLARAEETPTEEGEEAQGDSHAKETERAAEDEDEASPADEGEVDIDASGPAASAGGSAEVVLETEMDHDAPE